MKRRTELKRRTSLARGSKGLKRTRMKATPTRKAKARRARMAELRPLVHERAEGRCEVVIDGERCTRRFAHCHHRLPVGRGGRDELDNLLAVCTEHHIHIHHNPRWSVAHGYIRVSSVAA
jgi:predicted restriction endonuclease